MPCSGNLIALNLHQYIKAGRKGLDIFTIILIPVLALICGLLSRRSACKRLEQSQEKGENET